MLKNEKVKNMLPHPFFRGEKDIFLPDYIKNLKFPLFFSNIAVDLREIQFNHLQM